MPILCEGPNAYPADLLEHAVDSITGKWWVVYTKARQEKAVGRQLAGWECSFYLPLVKKHWLYRGRRLCSYLPVFPGYLFLYGSDDDRIRVLETNRISRFLEVEDQRQFLEDLRRVKRLIDAGVSLDVESTLVPGRRVRVCRGMFAGLEGTVLMRHGKTRLVIGVDFIQQGASFEIDSLLLEPID